MYLFKLNPPLRLLAGSNLTFTKAFGFAQAAELSEQNAKDLQRPETMEVHVVNKKGQERIMSTSNCYHCHGNHLASDHECRFRSADCNNCGKRGHIARACRQNREDRHPTSSASGKLRVPRSREMKQDSPELLQTGTLYNFCSPDPLKAPVKVNNVTIEMEIDTGAAASVISERTYTNAWALLTTDVLLCTYSGERLNIRGEIKVDVQFRDKQARLNLLVVVGNGPSLMGRDWINDKCAQA